MKKPKPFKRKMWAVIGFYGLDSISLNSSQAESIKAHCNEQWHSWNLCVKNGNEKCVPVMVTEIRKRKKK